MKILTIVHKILHQRSVLNELISEITITCTGNIIAVLADDDTFVVSFIFWHQTIY